MRKFKLIVFISVLFYFNNTYAIDKDSTASKKHWNFGFCFFNTLYSVNSVQLYNSNNYNLNTGLGLITYADCKIYKNLFINLGLGVNKLRLKTVVFISPNEILKEINLCMPLGIGYSYTLKRNQHRQLDFVKAGIVNKKPIRTKIYIKTGILRQALINTRVSNTNYINYSPDYFGYKTKNIIGNILFYKYNRDLNDYYQFINLGVSYIIFDRYRMTTEIEYLGGNGYKKTGFSISTEGIMVRPNNIGLKVGCVF